MLCEELRNGGDSLYVVTANRYSSRMLVRDGNRSAFVTLDTITQGFLYAPFGEITTEYAPLWQNGIIPKYAFNAKELDEETGMYYYEARYYNPPVFTSRDPHFERYFWTSPYGYCNNNPLKYIDPTGMDNVIYVVDLQGDNKAVDANKLISGVNAAFKKLGLNTRMMMAPDGANFDPRFMDKTDSYVVLGSEKTVINYLKSKDPAAANSIEDAGGFGGRYHPEESGRERESKGRFIAIDSYGLQQWAEKDLGWNKMDAAILTVLHGAGHNADLGHPDVDGRQSKGQEVSPPNCRIMNSANSVWSWRNERKLADYTNPAVNTLYKQAMRIHFGNNTAKSNYSRKNKPLY